MATKLKFLALLAIVILFIFSFARSFWAEPTLAQSEANHRQAEEEVFQDIVADFAWYSELLDNVQYSRDSIYPFILKAATLDEAVKWLSQGFGEDVARSLAYHYLAWDEDLAKLVLIPQDSIPVLTAKDRAATAVTFRNERQARLECFYYDCYTLGDCYRYTIETVKEGKHWKVNALSLEEIERGNGQKKYSSNL